MNRNLKKPLAAATLLSKDAHAQFVYLNFLNLKRDIDDLTKQQSEASLKSVGVSGGGGQSSKHQDQPFRVARLVERLQLLERRTSKLKTLTRVPRA